MAFYSSQDVVVVNPVVFSIVQDYCGDSFGFYARDNGFAQLVINNTIKPDSLQYQEVLKYLSAFHYYVYPAFDYDDKNGLVRSYEQITADFENFQADFPVREEISKALLDGPRRDLFLVQFQGKESDNRFELKEPKSTYDYRIIGDMPHSSIG